MNAAVQASQHSTTVHSLVHLVSLVTWLCGPLSALSGGQKSCVALTLIIMQKLVVIVLTHFKCCILLALQNDLALGCVQYKVLYTCPVYFISFTFVTCTVVTFCYMFVCFLIVKSISQKVGSGF